MWFPSMRAGKGQRVGACLCSACWGINRSLQSPRLSIQQLLLSATFQPNTQHYCSEAERNKLLSIRCTRVLSLSFPEAPGRAIFAPGSATNCLQINKATCKQQRWGKKWCDNICEWIMSLGRMGSDRNLSSAAATELFTAQPDGLVQQQPFRINNCFSGGRGSFRNHFAFRQEYFYFFFVVLSGRFALGEMSAVLKGGLKKRRNSLPPSPLSSLPPLSLRAAFPLPLASNIAAFNLEIMVTCMCILRVYHCCS